MAPSGPIAKRRCGPTSCFAREVVPHFKGTLSSLQGSRDLGCGNRPESSGPWVGHHAGHLGPSRRARSQAGPGEDDRVVTPRRERASNVGTRCRAARAFVDSANRRQMGRFHGRQGPFRVPAAATMRSSAAASASRVCRLSVSVGSIMRASSTISGKYTVGEWKPFLEEALGHVEGPDPVAA